MTQKRITIMTQDKETIIIEFQELYRHSFKSMYYLITNTNDLSSLGQAFHDWCSGLDIDLEGLKIAE